MADTVSMENVKGQAWHGKALPPFLPVRMLNEFTYCPRLGYLEWVQGEFADSADTVEGRFQHRTVDRARQRRRAAEEPAADAPSRIHERSVLLGSEELGLSAKIDLLRGEGNRVVPVDYKRGKRPHVPRGAYEPELVQLCAQGLLLREHGYECTEGVLYFAGSRERVRVEFDEPLVTRTIELAREMRAVAEKGEIPPPLVDSPKCPRCSLVGICLPDEVRFLSEGATEVRPLAPARDDALPLHVQHQGARIQKDGGLLRILDQDTVIGEARLTELSQVAVFGGVHITTPTIHELCRRDIPVTWLSHGGWFYGITHGMSHKNVELRRRQYAAAADPERSLALARRFVQAKIANCRTLLRRNHPEAPAAVLRDLKEDIRRAGQSDRLDALLGVEGTGAHRYFCVFAEMLRAPGDEKVKTFDFQRRNRRPPRDPVNALLSLAYAMLVREWTVVAQSVGLDPYLGFYHQPRYGRPALALDLMEEFRPLVGDSLVLTVVNNGEITAEHFVEALGAVSLTAAGRARFIEAYERRLSQEITHPVFGYRISYRRVFEVQARLLARHLTGEIPEYPSFTTR
jgi:CRISPR-associated endonuclease Cas1/CRISPR-associated protein Cas4